MSPFYHAPFYLRIFFLFVFIAFTTIHDLKNSNCQSLIDTPSGFLTFSEMNSTALIANPRISQWLRTVLRPAHNPHSIFLVS